MTTTWDETKIANLLCSAFAPHLGRQRSEPRTRPTANIDVLVTFDGSGVSSHPNHISLHHGARAFVAALLQGKSGWPSPVDLYSLSSVNVLRKYSSMSDMFTTLAGWYLSGGDTDSSGSESGSGSGSGSAKTGDGSAAQEHHPTSLVFMNALTGEGAALGTAWTAMTQAHKSQMVWFRYFWIGLSRYMLINDLKLEQVEAKS
jgi:N-acetylglucosaminylphosphatidylinositol deacetylase